MDDVDAAGWRQALAMAGLGAWHWDPAADAVVVAVPPAWRPGLPLPPAGFLAAVHPEDRAALEAALRQGAAAGGGWDATFRLAGGEARLRLAGAGAFGILSRAAPDRVAEAMDRAAEQARRAGEIIRRLREFVARGEAEPRPGGGTVFRFTLTALAEGMPA